MHLLSDIVKEFENDFKQKYQGKILPSHLTALSAWGKCRTFENNLMVLHCEKCGNTRFAPHSCGHRNCPHCQDYETNNWIVHQSNGLLPVEHYLLTFSIPPELNRFAWGHQRLIYSLLIEHAWRLIERVFKAEGGIPGAIAVLHTHTRELNYHPHVHFLIPNVNIDIDHKTVKLKVDFLSDFGEYASNFGAMMLCAMLNENLAPPTLEVKNWKIDIKKVGTGEQALLYLARNLYKGPLLEKDIVSCKDGKVTFQYRDGQTGDKCLKTLLGEDFLWLLLQHVLPKNFRRTRNFGFLSGNSKDADKIKEILSVFVLSGHQEEKMSVLPQRQQFTCKCCGHPMKIIATNITSSILSAKCLTEKMRM